MALADKGYDGQWNEAVLEARGLKNGIMEQAWRDHFLTKEDKTRNRLIGMLRYVVEQGFGRIKRTYGFDRAR
jgi:IS5 family transposase